MGDSNIGWTNKTWNCIIGCSKVSEGCGLRIGANCYAIGQVHRGLVPEHKGLTVMTEHGLDWTGEVRFLPERLEDPKHWRQPCMIFLNSLSDLFHEDLSLDIIQRVFAVMADTPQHTYQILTKRHQRLAELAPELPWPPNVWMGVSIELEKYLYRANHLRQVPAAVRFQSLEPLLGPLPNMNLEGIDWNIAGGQSGPGALPMDLDWVRDIRDHCAAEGVPLFVKQLGSVWARTSGTWGKGRGDGQDPSVWPEEFRVQQFPRRRRFVRP